MRENSLDSTLHFFFLLLLLFYIGSLDNTLDCIKFRCKDLVVDLFIIIIRSKPRHNNFIALKD